MKQVKAFGTYAADKPLEQLSIERRDVLENDIRIEILYCGICHSDLHYARNEWKAFIPTTYPCVPGHEIIGKVVEIGSSVTKFKVGDLAGVGCLVDSDRTCPACEEGLEQFCPNQVLTYGSEDKHTGGTTLGGYSESIVVDERFVLKVPEKLDISKAAPLLCAGTTTYSPMKHWKIGPNKRVGIVGLGGLGHMAVKFSHSFGAETVVFTTSERKFEDAIKLGADKVILSSDSDEMKKLSGSFDFIIDCVSADHDINAYINLLKCDGNITIVGAPEKPLSVHAFSLIFGRRSFSGSPIGGIPETQEMLDYCAEKNILPETELITIDKINEAYDRMLKGDVRYRFVIDIDSLRKSN
jgi:uncharacterized zinc-type alcohol dehydrogenase-like protein